MLSLALRGRDIRMGLLVPSTARKSDSESSFWAAVSLLAIGVQFPLKACCPR